MPKRAPYTSTELLSDPLLNKGSAFTQKERDAFGLNGLLPYHVSSMEEQLRRRYANFSEQKGELAKYTFLSALQNRNEVLFYRLLQEHVKEMLPLVYTPTVGEVSVQYSMLYKEHRGIYLSYPLKDKIPEIIKNIPKEEVDVIVVTDGERILGLGDLGVGGMAIPVGKLTLYTLFGGIHPGRVLPILLDVGTNNEKLLNDPLYIGWRHKRVTGKEYYEFMDLFVKAVKKKYPKVLLQWEDFAKPHARPLLEKYRQEICSFNDDIQGTAAVVLSALLTGVKVSKGNLADQRVVIFGGGGAGLGIAHYIAGMLQETGLTFEEARKNIYIIDINGLVHSGLKQLDPEQKKFTQSFEDLATWEIEDPSHISLYEVIKHVHPHVLIGVSGQYNVFTEEIVKEMSKHVEKPIIFPLSNPTSCAEAHPQDLIKWTKGRAIIATGSPVEPIHYKGKIYAIAQCNNVYIYPGVGLGLISSKAREVTDKLFYKAAEVLSEHSPFLKGEEGALFPSFDSLRSISKHIGLAVAQTAQLEGLAPKATPEATLQAIERNIWDPEYLSYVD